MSLEVLFELFSNVRTCYKYNILRKIRLVNNKRRKKARKYRDEPKLVPEILEQYIGRNAIADK